MNISECNEPVASGTKRIIAEKGLKNIRVAEKAGFNSQQFSDMLNGRRLMRAADIASIIGVIKEYGIDANYLFGLERGGD